MAEQQRQFRWLTGMELAVGSVATPLALKEGSHLYESWTHYPATNTNYPPRTAHDWHPSTLETVGVGVVGPLAATAALVAATSLLRYGIHRLRDHGQQPPSPMIEAPVPAGE